MDAITSSLLGLIFAVCTFLIDKFVDATDLTKALLKVFFIGFGLIAVYQALYDYKSEGSTLTTLEEEANPIDYWSDCEKALIYFNPITATSVGLFDIYNAYHLLEQT